MTDKEALKIIIFERIYKPLVDRWVLYDNAGTVPILLDEGGRKET